LSEYGGRTFKGAVDSEMVVIMDLPGNRFNQFAQAGEIRDPDLIWVFTGFSRNKVRNSGGRLV